MSSDMNEILELLNKISISESPKQLLTDLKIRLSGVQVNRHQNRPIPTVNDFCILFDSINSSDSEQVDLCVDVLTRLLPLIDAKTAIEQLGNHILRGFIHPNEKVRSLALKQVKLCAESEGGIQTLLSNKPILLGAVSCVGDESLYVVKVALDSMASICTTSMGAAAIFSNECISTLEQVMAKSDSSRFNVYELIVKVGLLHDEALALVSNSGLLDKLISEVTSGDILTQLNALELITNLAVNPAGLALLQQGGVVTQFQYLLSLTETDPLTAMLLPGLLKFFGNLGHVQPLGLAEGYRQVVSTLFKLASGGIASSEPVLEMVAFETLTHIGFSLEGKYALMKFKEEMSHLLNHMSAKLKNSTTDQKVRIIEAFIELFTVKPEEQCDEVLIITQEWWNQFSGANSIEKLVGLIKQPFPDLHTASLNVLLVLCNLPWGQRYISIEPGFIEYILDRTTESDKSGLELRYALVKTIVETPYNSQIFTDDILEKIKKYYKQGPFYVEAEPQVTFEGQGDE